MFVDLFPNSAPDVIVLAFIHQKQFWFIFNIIYRLMYKAENLG